MVEEIDFEKCNFRHFRGPVTLTLNRVIWHTVVHHSSTSMHAPNFIEIGQTFCGRTYRRRDVWTYLLTDRHSPSNVIRSTQRCRPNKNKNRDTQKKQYKVRGVSPEAGKKSMLGKICEKGRSWAGSERERELWMVRVVSCQSEKKW